MKRRAAEASKTTEASTPEFVYSDWMSDYDFSNTSTPHRVVKKTAKRVYVEDRSRSWEEQGQVFHNVTTIVLDREELETKGEVWSRRHRELFYTTPYEVRHRPHKPQFLEVLGLEVGCDQEAVNAAYRSLAKKHHPDHGGDAKDFKRLQAAYEEALATVKC